MEAHMELRDAQGLTEQEFIEKYKSKNYPRPYVTADIVLMTEGHGSILLIKRKGHPFMGRWALPGGFANEDESVDQTAARELQEETGIEGLELSQLGLYSTPGRDPRGWIVSEAYIAIVPEIHAQAGDDAADAQWFKIDMGDGRITLTNGDTCLEVSDEKSDLAFDHGDIIRKALQGSF